MRTFVVGDTHGRHRIVRELLEAAGIVDEDGARVRLPDVRTVHLGDLIHGTSRSRGDDLAILRKANAWFDVCLIGNHEYAYLGGFPFGGFRPSTEVEGCVRNVFWRPAIAVGDTLLTHAGVADLIGLRSTSAADAAVELAEAWLADRQHPFFAACSPARAGGRDHVGGILWKGAEERCASAFSQVHGHTPNPDGPRFSGDQGGIYRANLDVGARDGRVCGLWLDENGRPGLFLVAEAER